MDQAVKYPEVTVRLTGQNGNVFWIIGEVVKHIRRKVGARAADEFAGEAMRQESYDALLRLVMSTVNTK